MNEPPITTFQNDDKEFAHAIAEAQRTLDLFIGQLQNPKPAQTYFSVKARFPTSKGNAEHIWLDNVRYDGSKFSGKIGNTPQSVKNLHLGDPCIIDRENITDWMIVEDGRLVGGTTIRLARSRKSPAERIEFDRHATFRFE